MRKARGADNLWQRVECSECPSPDCMHQGGCPDQAFENRVFAQDTDVAQGAHRSYKWACGRGPHHPKGVRRSQLRDCQEASPPEGHVILFCTWESDAQREKAQSAKKTRGTIFRSLVPVKNSVAATREWTMTEKSEPQRGEPAMSK